MGKAAEQWAQFGIEGAQDVLQTGLGIAMAGYNDKRQIKQQGKLNDLMAKTSKDLTDYNYGKQMEMWHNTNYSAQMEELKKAGLNPALLYGMSGGGGVTTGSGSGASAGAAQAPAGGREIMDIQGLGIQKQMAQAQIEVMKSQANLNNTEANKKAGVDTELAKTTIASIAQGINNAKAQEQLTKADTYLRNIQGEVAGETVEEQIDQIGWNARQAMRQVQLAEQEVYIKGETLNDIVNTIKAEAIGAGLRNILTKAQTTQTHAQTNLTNAQTSKTLSDIEVNKSQIAKWSIELAQGWEGLSQKDRELKIKTFSEEIKAKFPSIGESTGRMLNDLLENVLELTPRQGFKGYKVDDKNK